MALEEYNKKRDFTKTAEPKGEIASAKSRRFVIQEHHASRLHFDLRLEMGGVLKSWAVPKGPSKDTKARRLAVMTEDHPVRYIDFEGHIPEGEYGAGDMAVWDHGTYEVREADDPEKAVADGMLKLDLHGEQLKGHFELIQTHNHGDNQWLLIKGKDEYVDPAWTLNQRIPGDTPAPKTAEAQHVPARKKSSEQASHTSNSPLPAAIEPMLATLTDKPFDDPNWLFEIKWDGYRAICFIENESARFISRNQLDFTPKMKALAHAAKFINATQAVIDGEIVALDETGKSTFQALQNYAGIRAKKGAAVDEAIVYEAFDLLFLNGVDYRSKSLTERKDALRQIVTAGGPIRYSDHVIGDGVRFFEVAKASGLEGVIAKCANSPYVERRDGNWLKIKAIKEQEVVIGGFTAPRNNRSHFGALIVGLYEDGKLVHCGQVGGGFNTKLLTEIHALLKPLVTDVSPFAAKPKTASQATWVRPELVCQVKFSEWTDDNQMRHPIFLGMRIDKAAREVVPEVTVPLAKTEAKSEAPDNANDQATVSPAKLGALGLKASDINTTVTIGADTVKLTNLNKVYWPEQGYTKRDLVDYYAAVASTMLPYLVDRPLVLQRYPNGYKGMTFYQHDIDEHPSFLRTVPRKEGEKTICYGVAENEASLVYLANLGVIPIHAWCSRAALPNKPDWVVFDLDPDQSDWKTACRVALKLRDILDNIGLRCYPKTSGSQGLHIYVPIKADLIYDEIMEQFAKPVGKLVTNSLPDAATTERMIKKRRDGQVYFDSVQNGEGKTVVAPYSVRPKPGATVSTPLTWDEVEHPIDPTAFTIKTVLSRIADKGDLFAQVLTDKQDLRGAVGKL